MTQVSLDLGEFQALLDESSIAKHGLPDLGMVVEGVRSVLGDLTRALPCVFD